jgi:8-oxo-dGTP diphosphatase
VRRPESKNGRVFFQQRPEGKDFAFSFETPGGKREGNESHHDAVRRELREELGLQIGAISEQSIWSGEVPLPGRPSIFLVACRVLEWKGDPKPLDGQPGFGWFTTDEIVGLEMTPGNKSYMLKLCELMTAARIAPATKGKT